jgi:hypothetical protein
MDEAAIIPSLAESRLQRRYMAEMWTDGDANRPTNIWPIKIRSRPVIPYYYENQDAKTKFSSILEEAINRWHTAIGDNAGIKFVPNCEDICDNIVDNRPVLNIRELEDMEVSIHYTGTGFGGYGIDDSVIYFTLEQENTQATSEDDAHIFTNVRAMTHELGRPPQFFVLKPSLIVG